MIETFVDSDDGSVVSIDLIEIRPLSQNILDGILNLSFVEPCPFCYALHQVHIENVADLLQSVEHVDLVYHFYIGVL